VRTSPAFVLIRTTRASTSADRVEVRDEGFFSTNSSAQLLEHVLDLMYVLGSVLALCEWRSVRRSSMLLPRAAQMPTHLQVRRLYNTHIYLQLNVMHNAYRVGTLD
jgi:hypothetical protein